jgi:hypothetical protein
VESRTISVKLESPKRTKSRSHSRERKSKRSRSRSTDRSDWHNAKDRGRSSESGFRDKRDDRYVDRNESGFRSNRDDRFLDRKEKREPGRDSFRKDEYRDYSRRSSGNRFGQDSDKPFTTSSFKDYNRRESGKYDKNFDYRHVHREEKKYSKDELYSPQDRKHSRERFYHRSKSPYQKDTSSKKKDPLYFHKSIIRNDTQ